MAWLLVPLIAALLALMFAMALPSTPSTPIFAGGAAVVGYLLTLYSLNRTRVVLGPDASS